MHQPSTPVTCQAGCPRVVTPRTKTGVLKTPAGTALDLLGRRPAEVMLVAAHNHDLAAARAHGMRTAFIPRPTEFGPRPSPDLRAEQEWDVIAEHMIELAERMCAPE